MSPQMRAHEPTLINGIRRHAGKRAFTLIELLVSIAIISILLGILLPSLSAARASGVKTVCLTNLHAIGAASSNYFNANDFPPYFWDGITLEDRNFSFSWSDFLVRGRHLETEVAAERIPDPSDPDAWPGVYLAGMASQRAKVFQCPAQIDRVWGDVNNIPVSYRADYVATGYNQSLPTSGIYKRKETYRSADLIWLGESFTTLGGIRTREYVRETQLQVDLNEANPLRHLGGGNYLFGDGHAEWNSAYHLADYDQLGQPWEIP